MIERKPVIEVVNLSFQYPLTTRKALDGVNLKVYEGEFVGIVGPCGAGKTTLCLCLTGLIPHHVIGIMEGDVYVYGMNTKEVPVRELAKIINIVFDNPEYQLSQMTVEEEVALGLENLGLPREEIKRRIKEVLRIVGLEGLEKRSPFELSGGQQQRLAIASVLAMYPKILVLDEPTSHLDPVGKDEVYWVVKRLNKERGMTIIMADHEVEMLALCADRILIMNEGKIVLEGSPREVFSHVDFLKELGLRIPQVTELAYHLRRLGMWSGQYPVSIDEAIEVVRRILGVEKL